MSTKVMEGLILPFSQFGIAKLGTSKTFWFDASVFAIRYCYYLELAEWDCETHGKNLSKRVLERRPGMVMLV